MNRPKVGINGLGRIGRLIFRHGLKHLDIVGINDTSNPRTIAHLLKYDSSHGKLDAHISYDDSALIINDRKIPVSSEKDPSNIPWKKWDAHIILECTGAFKEKKDFEKHISAGARKVIVSAPAEGIDKVLVYGVNHTEYNTKSHSIISNASCTTNCLAPIAYILHKEFKILNGLMTTVHSYTNDQRILDVHHKDLRRARSAAMSMIPTTTGAARAVGCVLPELDGKIDGFSVRVPTPNVSLVDFVAHTQKPVTVDQVNSVLTKAAGGSLQGILEIEKDPLVSIDYMGSPASATIDLLSTLISGDHLVKVVAWYDNEMGFSCRMIDLTKYIEAQET